LSFHRPLCEFGDRHLARFKRALGKPHRTVLRKLEGDEVRRVQNENCEIFAGRWRNRQRKGQREDEGESTVPILEPVILWLAKLDRLVSQNGIGERAKLFETINIDLRQFRQLFVVVSAVRILLEVLERLSVQPSSNVHLYSRPVR